MKVKSLNAAWVRRLIPRRSPTAHKGDNGHVLLVAGSRGMVGAAVLSGLGVLKSGGGLLTLALPPSVRRLVTVRFPEAMTIDQSVRAIRQHMHRRKISTLAVGPGLGVGASQRKLVLEILSLRKFTVLDADGLNNSRPKDLLHRPIVITPHSGELARLLGKSIREIQKDRIASAVQTAQRLGVICVLKGHETVISDGSHTFLNRTGNAAMATGGMGDVLTGVVAGLLAQGLSLLEAACAGVYLHGLAGDLAAQADRGLLASELATCLPRAFAKTAGRS